MMKEGIERKRERERDKQGRIAKTGVWSERDNNPGREKKIVFSL